MEADAKLERLFFALWPPSALQRELAALADTALPPHRGGRRTYTQNLHLTLVFLGAADAATRARLERGADALHVLAFELQLDRIG
jgi:2'-5' RNA ligase